MDLNTFLKSICIMLFVAQAHAGPTELTSAACKGHVDGVIEQLQRGTDPNSIDPITKRYPIICAANVPYPERRQKDRFDRHIEIVKILKQAGASLEATDTNGLTALSNAVYVDVDAGSSMKMTRVLLDLGANPNQSSSAESPLRSAISMPSIDAVKVLIQRGAKPTITDVQYIFDSYNHYRRFHQTLYDIVSALAGTGLKMEKLNIYRFLRANQLFGYQPLLQFVILNGADPIGWDNMFARSDCPLIRYKAEQEGDLAFLAWLTQVGINYPNENYCRSYFSVNPIF